MFKNVALFFILYTIAMVTIFSVINAIIFGSEKCWLAIMYWYKNRLYSKNNSGYEHFVNLNTPQEPENGFVDPTKAQHKLITLDPSSYHNRPEFKILAANLQWDFASMDEWRKEKDEIMALKINSYARL